MIEFEPSDIIVDEKRGQLLVASLNEIVKIIDDEIFANEIAKKNGDLILHLALDSTPPVWSLKLTEKEGGLWELPSCAS